MNADRLLKHFERISDAADAVPRLRRFVLDLAVRGALVAARTSDAPADVPDAANRPPQGKAVELPIDSLPFIVPSTWRWAYLTEVADVLYGFAFASGRFNASRQGMPLIRIRDISSSDTEAYFEGEYDDRYVVRKGDYLIGMDGDFNVRKWAGREALLNQRVLRINKWHRQADAAWCAIPLQMILDHIHGQTSQTTVKHLSAKQMNGVRIPLPPLAEQHRIVAKVDELMALCDRLETAQVDREARRDRLVSASLARVTEPDVTDSTSATNSARFHLDQFARLTTRPEHAKQLRQTILNLAVRGRLVPQDPSDAENTMPTSARTLAEETSSRRRRKVPHVDISTLPVAIPPHWKRVTLAELVVRDRGISYGVLVPGPDVSDGIPFVRAQDLSLAANPPAPNKTISATVEKPYARTRLQGDEILLCVVGSIGKLGLVPPSWKGANIARAVARIAPGPHVSREYLLAVLRSTTVQSFFSDATRTLAQPTLNVGLIEQTEIPLPPLAEQRRIVAKVDELMALCDRLEASLASAATDRARLLEALLHEALAAAA